MARLESQKIELHQKIDVLHMLTLNIREEESKHANEVDGHSDAQTKSKRYLDKLDLLKQTFEDKKDLLKITEAQVSKQKQAVRNMQDRIELCDAEIILRQREFDELQNRLCEAKKAKEQTNDCNN